MRLRRTLSSLWLPLLAALVVACGAPEPGPRIAEPSEALRPAAQRGVVPVEARIADYEIHAKLDEVEHSIKGRARVSWRNTSTQSVGELAFHLYMNGFRSEDTGWMQTSRGSHRLNEQEAEGAWGYVDIASVLLVGDDPPTRDVGENPDRMDDELRWSEGFDPSPMTVELPAPVAPGESVTVELEFTTQLPRVVARTGYFGDFHAVGQWYPKIAVLEEHGWQNYVFTYHDEFYADFGNYDVILDVPEAMVVGATGIRTAETAATDGRKILTYRAEMVHDFAWMGDPEFVEHFGEFDGVRIRQLLPPERLVDAEAHLAAQRSAFESYERRFGPYPWSTLTIVHPPDGARGAGGMEYPTLFTSSNRRSIPTWVRASVFDDRVSGLFTTIHEFGHQYFQGLFASREHLEPWLDEGMNTMSNILALTDWLGDDPWIMRIRERKLYVRDLLRLGLQSRAFLQSIDRPAASFDGTIGNYGSTVYGKTAAVMLTLRNLVGIDEFDRALRVYAERARFRHPRGEDLEATLVAELGARVKLGSDDSEPVWLDVQEYLDQALRSRSSVEFSILKVANRRRMGTAGWHRDDGGVLQGGEPPPTLELDIEELDDDQVEGLVAIHRAGEFVVPVEVEVEMADGEVERRVWDGSEPTVVLTWPGRRVKRATLDPDGDLLLEVKLLNNSAIARGFDDDDGLSGPLGLVAEAVSLVVVGAFGP